MMFSAFAKIKVTASPKPQRLLSSNSKSSSISETNYQTNHYSDMNKLREQIEKVLWKNYIIDPDIAMNMEEICDEIMPLITPLLSEALKEMEAGRDLKDRRGESEYAQIKQIGRNAAKDEDIVILKRFLGESV